MTKKAFIIKVDNETISFNPQVSISIQQTNIPPKEYLSFKTSEEIFWKVEMINHDLERKFLELKIIDYNNEDIQKFNDQKKPNNEIIGVSFGKFDWEKLEPILTRYQKSKFEDILFNTGKIHLPDIGNFTNKVINSFQNSTYKPNSAYVPDLTERKENISIRFDDLTFMSGYVSFKKKFKYINKEHFQILNQNILPEFENIKHWFAKKLKLRVIKVVITFVFEDNKILEIKALSEQIDLINSELIDSIKYERVLDLTKKTELITPQKALFTNDELFTQIDLEDNVGNVFNQSEEDVLNLLLEKGSVRNKMQLQYLADKRQSDNLKLRYTLKPNFGFLFFVEGEANNHFIWELLNSNATYIWSISTLGKDVDSQFKRIESTINLIRTIGREKYKTAYRVERYDNDLVFKIINHEEIESNLSIGFLKWEKRLEEHLI